MTVAVKVFKHRNRRSLGIKKLRNVGSISEKGDAASVTGCFTDGPPDVGLARVQLRWSTDQRRIEKAGPDRYGKLNQERPSLITRKPLSRSL